MYATLKAPHARDALKGPELEAKLKKLGAFVLNRRFDGLLAGMALHGHFPVAVDEAILDHVDADTPAITTRVVPSTQVTPGQATTWGFTPDGQRVVLGWSDGAHADAQLITAVDECGAFLAGEGLTTALAVFARCEPFPVGPDKILLEQTDEGARTQLTTVAARSEVPPERIVAWYFTWDGPRERGHIRPDDVLLVPVRGCDPGCVPDSHN